MRRNGKPIRNDRVRSDRRQRGAVSILAMMFLVIFGSLAAAMAIVAQGNLATADSHMKINRSIAAAETGMDFIVYRINEATQNVITSDGEITASNAPTLWAQTRAELLFAFANEFHNLQEPYEVGNTLHVGPIAVAPGAPTFEATFTPHPLAGEDYDGAYYQRPPYDEMDPPVSSAAPLNATWIRVKIVATDGPSVSEIHRAIQMDFRVTKKIEFALLSKSRVMIGRNVIIDGTVGSRFIETHLANGHPIQMLSDFRGINSDLDDDLDAFIGSLITNDQNGDNRLALASASETSGIADPGSYDFDGDGYITDYDFFLARFDSNADGRISHIELDTAGDVSRAQLFELIDTFGYPGRPGFDDGFIDVLDRYSKIHGQIKLTAAKDDWESGAAGGAYQDFLTGVITPDHGKVPMEFEASDASVHQFTPSDFDVSTFRAMAAGDLTTQASNQAALHDPLDPDSPQPLGEQVFEAVPFGAAHPYDYYDRPVYKNMTFTDITIPKGANALFVNCTFIGVTFIETETNNQHTDYNFAGMQESDGALKHPDAVAVVNGVDVNDTKAISNNVRFDNCTFEGSIVTDAPLEYTHVRNKIAFTGATKFLIDDSTNLTQTQKDLFKRSTILAPHQSIEMGTFVNPADSNEVVRLSGTIVAGLIDMRGQVKVTGSILTTFEPKSNEGPVVGDTSPQFNTTLGYFPSDDGDLEAELPANGIGVIHVKYDPTIPLPDGILGPISIEPVKATYFEGGK